jgi:hypothetical protein
MNAIIGLKANYELQLKNVITENEKLKKILEEQNYDKQRENQEIKTSLVMDSNEKVESLKMRHAKNASVYEEQLRKMKDIVQEREKEIYEL